MTTTTTSSSSANEYKHVERLIKELKDIVERENKRPMGYEHLDLNLKNLIEYEIIPVLEEHINWEPSDEDLTGEPPLSSAEMHHQAWVNHVAMHS
jgi:hypothetical protein